MSHVRTNRQISDANLQGRKRLNILHKRRDHRYESDPQLFVTIPPKPTRPAAPPSGPPFWLPSASLNNARSRPHFHAPMHPLPSIGASTFRRSQAFSLDFRPPPHPAPILKQASRARSASVTHATFMNHERPNRTRKTIERCSFNLPSSSREEPLPPLPPRRHLPIPSLRKPSVVASIEHQCMQTASHKYHHGTNNESGEVDISILHASDGDKWKNYLYEVFTHLVPGDDRARGIRVEASNVEEIEENLGKLQAVKLKGSKLQIVIMSPCFLDHVANHGKSELGQVFKPEKVLALLLGVDNSQLTMAHLSALYSYCDWHKLKVRDMDPSFVDEVLTEGIKILNNSELYSKYQDERNARFKVTPRKVTELQQLVHLLLNDPVYTKKDIEILIESPSKPNVTVEKFRLRNPYTIEFRMPDEFLASSSLVLVTVLVQKQHIGSRQVKCESSLDSVRSHLTILTDPTIFMCQALNINHASNQLDQKMTEAVKTQVPLCKLKEKRKEKCYSEFPTMVHFSAYYGLEQLTWTLLEIPGGEAALNVPNQNGHTPSVLAYQKGFHLFAHTLEDAALMASLAEKLNYEPLHYKNISKARSTNIAQELYSSPPPPRPLNSPLYDHPPSPQEVLKHTVGSSSVEVPQCGPAVDDTSSSVSELCSPPPPPYPCEHNLFSTSLTTAAQTEERKQDGRYLDMKATQDFRETELYEYSEDVYTLVTAWLEKTNMKAFVETHQEKIDEVKSKLDLNTTKEEYYNPENTPGASAEVTAQEADKNMVEQFCTLLRGARSSCEPPSDSGDDLDCGATSNVLSESKCELPTCTATASQEVSEEQLEKISSSSESAGLKIIPNMMPPAYSIEERPPQPPPRPYCQGEYLKPEDLNALTNTLVIGSTESNTGVPRYYNTTLRRSSSAERGTHCQDQTAEMLYAIVK
ncbi:uncharacterized protein LOC123505658 isoform X4 [Portunus trituberculatus]|uniref:uncharacterized protein LOC123505658 isoform X4 n=1 Tax=Portunus trituberculatus TaxID=210409 RepID=UPI001E1CF095|nr:uncharacterized protein LOC123505658 isoform X4 [Portunus trituberculatus]